MCIRDSPNPYYAITSAVQNVTSKHNGKFITINWSSVTGAENYLVKSTTSTLASNTNGTSVTFSNDGNTTPFIDNGVYSYNVTAYTLSTNTFTNGSQTIYTSNLASSTVLSSAVTLTVPPLITNFTIKQTLATLVTNWDPYNTYPSTNPDDKGTVYYSVLMTSNNSTISNYYGTNNSNTFNITAGSTYTLSLIHI